MAPCAGHRVHRVLRTTRREPAATGRAKEENLRRRNQQAIHPHGQDQDMLEQIHQFFNRPARFKAAKKSFSTSANLLPAIELRATNTSSTGANSCWCSRKLSRSNRRARLRSIAPPIFLLVTTPSFEVAPSGKRFQLAIKQPSASRCPCARMRENARFCASRESRPRRSRGTSAVMRGSNRREAFTAQTAAVAEDSAATLGGCAGTEPVLPFAPNF